MLRSIAELAAYGTFAVLLTAASVDNQNTVSSAAIDQSRAAVLEQHRAGAIAASHAAPAPAVGTDRGALLFAVKGCVGCHTHASLPNARMRVGPDLTALVDRAATRVTGLDARTYVRQSLREPNAYRVTGYETVMPDLRLTDAEIESLTAFLLAPAR